MIQLVIKNASSKRIILAEGKSAEGIAETIEDKCFDLNCTIHLFDTHYHTSLCDRIYHIIMNSCDKALYSSSPVEVMNNTLLDEDNRKVLEDVGYKLTFCEV